MIERVKFPGGIAALSLVLTGTARADKSMLSTLETFNLRIFERRPVPHAGQRSDAHHRDPLISSSEVTPAPWGEGDVPQPLISPVILKPARNANVRASRA